MFLASLLRRIAFSYYDYKAYNFNIEKTDFVVIHIPDQIGDAMAIFPVIRALELHKIKHLLIVTSTINLEVFNALKLEQTKLTLVTMTMQDHATLKEIKDLAKNITQQYGTPDLCIEGMRKKNLKTMLFISQLKAKTEFSGCWYNHELLLPFVQERVQYGSETPGSRTYDMGIYDA